jgi:hypothetical protein
VHAHSRIPFCPAPAQPLLFLCPTGRPGPRAVSVAAGFAHSCCVSAPHAAAPAPARPAAAASRAGAGRERARGGAA